MESKNGSKVEKSLIQYLSDIPAEYVGWEPASMSGANVFLVIY
jgi:hypothetical protein